LNYYDTIKVYHSGFASFGLQLFNNICTITQNIFAEECMCPQNNHFFYTSLRYYLYKKKKLARVFFIKKKFWLHWRAIVGQG